MKQKRKSKKPNEQTNSYHQKPSKALIARLKKIRCLAVDIDGVMTDGHIWLDTNGEWRRHFYIRDGMGMINLKRAGFQLAFITSSLAQDIKARAQRLEINHNLDNIREKGAAFEELVRRSGLSADEIAFIGDDIIDIPVFRKCGLAVAVADAMPEVIDEAHHITEHRGGHGAVREICDLLLKYGPNLRN